MDNTSETDESPQAAGGEANEPDVKPASLAGMAASFTKSMVKFAASGFQTVDQEIHDARANVCADCKYANGNKCTLCGCFTDKKAWLPHEDCPIGRWPV